MGANNLYLEISAMNGDIETVRKLVKAGADINTKDGVILREAIHQNNLPLVKEFVELGATINMPYNGQWGYNQGLAASLGHTEIFDYLLDNGAHSHLFATSAAVQTGHTDILKSLTARGLPLDFQDNDLTDALGAGHIDTVLYIAQHGSEFTQLTTLSYLDYTGHEGTLKQFIKETDYTPSPAVQEALKKVDMDYLLQAIEQRELNKKLTATMTPKQSQKIKVMKI